MIIYYLPPINREPGNSIDNRTNHKGSWWTPGVCEEYLGSNVWYLSRRCCTCWGTQGWPPEVWAEEEGKSALLVAVSGNTPRKPSWKVPWSGDNCPWRGVIFQPATFRIRLGLLQVRLWTHLGWDWQANLSAFQRRCVILALFSSIFYDQIVEKLSSHNTDNTSCRSDGLVPENTIYCPAQGKVFLTDLSASFFRFFQSQHPRRMKTASGRCRLHVMS